MRAPFPASTSSLQKSGKSYRPRSPVWRINSLETFERNGLDGHLIHTDGAIFNGFYIYEDFEEANRARIDAAGNKKLKISKFLNELSE